jgi:hypothetical protein
MLQDGSELAPKASEIELLSSDPALRWQVEHDLAGRQRRSGAPPMPGSPPKALAPACSPSRAPTASGRAVRTSPLALTSAALKQPRARATNAYMLANGAWLGADVSALAQWFLDHRTADGGWNCEWVEGSTRSSFHSTLNVLKGLL